MTREKREEAIKRLKKVKSIIGLSVSEKMSLDMAIKALEQELCEDAISRQAVLDVIKSMSNANPSYWNVCDVVDRKDLIDEVEQLLPVTPQSKTGHWIEKETSMECPNCHDIWHYEENQTERFKCCPTCGIRSE